MATAATASRKSAASAQEPAAQDAAAPGCVFMYRKTSEDGQEPQRIEVDAASGSVDVMKAQGWAEEL